MIFEYIEDFQIDGADAQSSAGKASWNSRTLPISGHRPFYIAARRRGAPVTVGEDPATPSHLRSRPADKKVAVRAAQSRTHICPCRRVPDGGASRVVISSLVPGGRLAAAPSAMASVSLP